MTDDARAAADLLTAYARAWADGSPDGLAALWDADRFRFYKAEEVGHVFTRWDEVLDYWRNNAGMHRAVRLGFDAVAAWPLEGGWSTAWCRMRWDIRFSAGAPGPLAERAMGGWNHVLLLTRRGRLAGWSETPDAAITYLRALYEDQARGV